MDKVRAIKECLKSIINEEVTDDIVDYILTFNNPEDYEEFMQNMINPQDPDHLRVYKVLEKELFGGTNLNKKSNNQNREILNFAANNSQNEKHTENNKGKAKKTKFSPFYGQDNVELRKGRHPCNCQAAKHELINNCNQCGRIVCQQEGSGPCFFCGNIVCTRYEMEVLNAKTKESDRLYNHLMEQKTSKEWKRALENRNKLLAVDQSGEVKNKVFDDQNDYFDVNSKWTGDCDRETMKKRYIAQHQMLHRSKREFKLALDFASRTATVESENETMQKKKLLKGVNKLLEQSEKRFPKNLFEGDKNELMMQIVELMDQSSLTHQGLETNCNKEENLKKDDAKRKNKFMTANDDLLGSIDQGLCLSMHQPWASLLVAGIKVHEGRTWKTEHRGRLWIAAAAKEPEDEEILTCEEMYRVLYSDDTIKFPKKYPTKCLLGCVFVEDCLDQAAYREKYGESGESSSPYVLICSNPVILPIFYPIQGQHKIFQLSKEIHRTAKAALMSSKWV